MHQKKPQSLAEAGAAIGASQIMGGAGKGTGQAEGQGGRGSNQWAPGGGGLQPSTNQDNEQMEKAAKNG